MLDEFIPQGISSRVVVMKDDSSERQDYGANLVENNEENNLHHAIGSASINKSGLLSRCIYTYVNESKQNRYLKLISGFHNLSDNNAMKNYNDEPKPVIGYNLHKDGKPLNNWDNPDIFTIAFFALFSYRDGGHITPRFTKVSLHAWLKWVLSHHSRHFA